MRYYFSCLFIIIIFSCQTRETIPVRVHLPNIGDKLCITYLGEEDVVQFKMFEGLHIILEKTKQGYNYTSLSQAM